MDWGQQRTSEGKLCGKKGRRVLLIWWLEKGKCSKSPLSTRAFLHHGMQTLAQDDLGWNVSHDQQQSCDGTLTREGQSFLTQKGNKQGLWRLPSLGHQEVLLCVLPSPSQLEAMGSLGNGNHLSLIKMSLALSLLRHASWMLLNMVKWLDQFGLNQTEVPCKHFFFFTLFDHFYNFYEKKNPTVTSRE